MFYEAFKMKQLPLLPIHLFVAKSPQEVSRFRYKDCLDFTTDKPREAWYTPQDAAAQLAICSKSDAAVYLRREVLQHGLRRDEMSF